MFTPNLSSRLYRPSAAESELPAGRRAEPLKLDFLPELLAFGAVLALAAVTVIGPLGVLTFIAGTGALIVWRPRACLRDLVRFSPLFLLPLLAMLSTMWSAVPPDTMRAGLEVLLTVVATIVLCRNLRGERLVLAMFIANFIIVLTVLPNIPFALATGYPLGASWGSKNSVGFASFMLTAFSLALVVDRRQFWVFRIFALAAIPFALAIGYLAQSGSAVASLAILLVVFPALVILGWFRLPVRLGIIAFATLLVALSSFFLRDLQEGVTDFRSQVLGKDATLTGRTYLWDFARRLSADHPIWGGGYGAFWQHGNIDAEGLWRWGGIASRSGFNFHNAFIEIRVDLGYVGLVLLAATCVVVMLVALVRQMIAPSIPLACLIAVTTVSYVRSYVEDGLFAPFSLVTLIWFATLIYAIPAGRGVVGRKPRATAPNTAAMRAPRRERWRPRKVQTVRKTRKLGPRRK